MSTYHNRHNLHLYCSAKAKFTLFIESEDKETNLTERKADLTGDDLLHIPTGLKKIMQDTAISGKTTVFSTNQLN